MQVNLEDLKIGMEVSRDVRNSRGQVLMAGGTVIEAKHVRVLKTWGVRSLAVKNPDEETKPINAINRSHIEAAAVAERQRFTHCDLGDPVQHALYMLAVKRRALRAMHE